MGVFDTEKHSNVKRKAEYRRIKKNYKTLEKFKQEKLRQKPDFGANVYGKNCAWCCKFTDQSKRERFVEKCFCRDYV